MKVIVPKLTNDKSKNKGCNLETKKIALTNSLSMKRVDLNKKYSLQTKRTSLPLNPVTLYSHLARSINRHLKMSYTKKRINKCNISTQPQYIGWITCLSQ